MKRTVLNYLLTLLGIISLSCSEEISINDLNKTSADFTSQAEYDSAIYYANKSLKINDNDSDSYYSFYLIGLSHHQQRSYLLATNYYLKAIETIPSSLEFNKDRYLILNNMGTICKSFADYKNAIVYYKEAIKYVNENDKKYPLYNLGNVFRKKEDYKQASTFYLEALDLVLKDNDYSMQIRIYHQLGTVYSSLGDYEKSRKYFNNVISFAGNGKTKASYEGRSLHNIGNTYMETEDYRQAIVYLKMALDKKSSTRRKFITLKDLGTCYLKLSDHENAVKYLSMAKAAYPEVDQLPENFELFRILENTYRVAANREGQNESIDQYYLQSTSYIKTRDEIIAMYSSAQLDAHIDGYYTNTSLTDDIRRYENLILMSTVGVILLFAFMYYLRKRELYKKRLLAEEIAQQMLAAVKKDASAY